MFRCDKNEFGLFTGVLNLFMGYLDDKDEKKKNSFYLILIILLVDLLVTEVGTGRYYTETRFYFIFLIRNCTRAKSCGIPRTYRPCGTLIIILDIFFFRTEYIIRIMKTGRNTRYKELLELSPEK